MKLVRKISLLNLISISIIFIISGFAYYHALNHVMKEELNEDILESKEFIVRSIEKGDFPHYPPYIIVREIDFPGKESDSISTVELKDLVENEMEPFLQLKSVVDIKGKKYEIVIRESLIESEDLLYTISFSLAILLILLIITIMLLNYFISIQTFRPFKEIMDKLRNFSLAKPMKPEFPETGTKEFRELEETLDVLINKTINDYNNLKEFTANASHEMQTPLTIIKSKIESLIQDASLNKKNLESISRILNSVNRLSRMTSSLLLLSKIEGRNFEGIEKVNFNLIIENLIKEYDELLWMKNIEINAFFKDEFILEINRELSEILVNNLISNALKYNIAGGGIRIVVDNDKIIFSNSGENPIKESRKIFERFKKEDQTSSSLGLGLAIAKKICDIYDLKIEYSFEAGAHNFIIKK